MKFITFINLQNIKLFQMRLILLPGLEKLNETWTQEVRKGFNSDFESISVVNHITDMSGIINEEDLDLEVNNLSKLVNGYKDNCVIFAKTTGILVALKAIALGKIRPRKCTFLQIPIMRARINNLHIDDWLYRYDVETLFIQRRDDSEFYFNDMSNYLKTQKIENFQLAEVETLDFDLQEIQKYKNFVLEYLSEVNKERRLSKRIPSSIIGNVNIQTSED